MIRLTINQVPLVSSMFALESEIILRTSVLLEPNVFIIPRAKRS